MGFGWLFLAYSETRVKIIHALRGTVKDANKWESALWLKLCHDQHCGWVTHLEAGLALVFKSSLNTGGGKSTFIMVLLGFLSFPEIQVSWGYGIQEYGRGTIFAV